MPIDVDRLTAALADRYAIEREIGRGGMATEAIAPFQRVVAKIPNDPYKVLLLAYVYARSGREDRAREILANIAALEEDPFELLDRVVEAQARGIEYLMMGLWWLEVEPRADPLRDDPRWDDFMRRIAPAE